MAKKIQLFIFSTFLWLTVSLFATNLNVKDIANSGLNLSFSNVHIPHPQQFIKQLQAPCQNVSTTANHIGDYCAVWQLLTDSIVSQIANMSYQFTISYSAATSHLQLSLQSTANQSDQVYLQIGLNQVTPFALLSLISSLNNTVPLQTAIDNLQDAEITTIQANIQLQSMLPFKQLARYAPLYRNAENKLDRQAYPLVLNLKLNYANVDQKLYFSAQGVSENTGTVGIEFEGLIDQPVTIGKLAEVNKEIQSAKTVAQASKAMQQLDIKMIPIYVGIELSQQNLFYDVVSLMLNHADTYTLKALTSPLIQKQQQLAEKSQNPVARNFHGSIATFFEQPVSLRMVMTPQGQSMQYLWEAWYQALDVLQLEQALVQNTFALQAADTFQAKKDIQRKLNHIYFEQQSEEEKTLVLLDSYFRMDFFVNGQPYKYLGIGS
jgi:hypothetical protein